MVEESYTESAIVDVWDKFLRGFKQEGKYVYFEAIQRIPAHNRKTLYFNYDHLVQSITEFRLGPDPRNDQFDVLRKMVVYETDQARDTLRKAAFNLLKELDAEYAEAEERIFRAEFMNAPIEKNMTQITVQDSGTFVRVMGLVQEYDSMAATVTHSTLWKCKDAGHKVEMEGVEKPKKCPECDCRVFDKDEKKTRTEDYIRFRLQQKSDKTYEGKDPAELEFETYGPDNINTVLQRLKFSDYVAVDGIVRTRNVKRTTGQGKPVGEPYIEACYMERLPESQIIAETDSITMDQIRHTIDPKKEAESVERVVESVCPSLLIGSLLRKIILLLAVGGDSFRQEDGTRVRGEIHLMLVGDPGVGKSRVAEYLMGARDRVLYNSGGKSTNVGLVGGYIYDKDGVGRIRSGVFGLASNGIVILDEFADRPDADYQNLLEPLSDKQTISIAKGTFYKSWEVNTGVLAIANPSTYSRYYDPDRNILENTNIPSPIIQRFDAILVWRDVAEAQLDEQKARHFFNVQRNAISEPELRRGGVAKPQEGHYSILYINRWIKWVRETFHPKTADSPEAVERIVKWYRERRNFKITINKEKGIKRADDPDNKMDIPAADMRDLGAIMRFAQASARTRQSDYVTVADVEEAIMIVDLSLAEAGHHRTLEDGTKEYLSDKFAERNRLIKDRQAQQMRHIFEGALDALTWRKCYSLREGGCGGAGHVTPIGDDEPKPCQMCDNSSGYINEKFYKGDLIHRLRLESGEKPLIPGSSFEFLWAEYLKRRAIIPLGPNQFMNNTPRLMREPTYAKIAPADDARKDELRRKIAEMRPRRTDELNSL